MNLSELNSLLLSLTWVLPLASVAILALIPDKRIKITAVVFNGVNLGLISYLSFIFFIHPPLNDFHSTTSSLLFETERQWFTALNIHYHTGVDAISMAMMLMAAIVIFCGTLASLNINERTREFFILLQILAAGVYGSFITFDLFAFFVFNELTLIPTYLLIALFGSGRKEYAAMKLNLMLMGGSALILLGIMGLYFESGIHSFDILQLSQIHFDKSFQLWAFPVLFLGFAILGNLFPFHIWSPDGHASAPTAVSMFLAGVHMKLGSYGCLRIAMYLLPEGCHEWMNVFLILAAAGVLWGGLVALKQKDLKYMNAYSSVSHCGLVFLGLAFLNTVGLRGAVMQMLAHGFITATLFCLIGMIYSRTHTRKISEMSGLMASMPFLSVSLIIAGLAALGLPGLAGFAAELNIFLGGFSSGKPLVLFVTALTVFSIVITAIYILRSTNSILNGPPLKTDQTHSIISTNSASPIASISPDANRMEKVALILLLTCIFIMGLFPGKLITLIDQALLPILNQLNR